MSRARRPLSAAAIAAPYVRGAYAAGKLSVGFWDHWVPGANEATEKLIKEWAEKEKVEVSIDYIPSQGNKNLLTIAAEAQAKSGHDILAFPTWLPAGYAEQLEPVDDIMEPLIKQNGDVNDTVKYLGKVDGKWLAVPATVGSQIKGPCSRIDLLKQHAGIDIQAMYPAGARAEGRQLEPRHLPEGCRSLPQGRQSVRRRSRHDVGLGRHRRRVLPRASAPMLVDAKGNITVKTDAVRQALEYCKKLVAFMPPDAPAWDDASNNKWLVSGRGVDDHEPAERLGGRQARRAAGRRAVLDARLPVRAEGPLRAVPAVLLGHLELQQEQVGGEEPAACICRSPPSAEKMVAASGGYDLPSFEKLHRPSRPGPRKGRRRARSTTTRTRTITRSCRSPPRRRRRRSPSRSTPRAIQTKMIVRHMQGEAMEKTLAWAESEVEGFMRT